MGRQFALTPTGNRTYRRLVKAFPHLEQSSQHKRLENIRAYLEQRKSRS